MKTKLLFTFIFLTQIILAQQVTLLQPALRDSDKNIVKQEYYIVDINTDEEHKDSQVLYSAYDDEKNPTGFNYEIYDENEDVVDSGNSVYFTFEYYPIDEYYSEMAFFYLFEDLFPSKSVDFKILNTNTNELLDDSYTLFPKDFRHSDFYEPYLELITYQYDGNFNIIGGSKKETIMQGDYPSESLYYSFNETTNQIELDYKLKYYNTFSNGDLIERIATKITDFTTNVEDSYEKEVFIYTANTFEHQYSRWDSTLNDWKFNRKSLTTYNANNKVLSIVQSYWDNTSSQWKIGYEFNYNYNALGLLETYSKEGDQWSDFYTYHYNSDNLLTEIITESYLNGIYNSKNRRLLYYDLETASTNSINTSKISIFPNPTNNILNIDLEENFNYQIYSIQGKILKEGKANKQIQVNDLEKGIYFININTNNLEEKHKFIID